MQRGSRAKTGPESKNKDLIAKIIEYNNIPVENIGSRFLPVNAENTITSDAIKDGNLMVNFQDEFGHGRLYKLSTYFSMQQKKNPYTQAPITALRQYTAVIGAPPLAGGRRTGAESTGVAQLIVNEP